MKPELYLIGGGGHCKSCIDVIEMENRYRIAGIVDSAERIGDYVLGYPIMATDKDIPSIAAGNSRVLITIGQIADPQKRIDLYSLASSLNIEFATVVSPTAYVSRHASIGQGTIVMHHAVINAGAIVSSNCIINTRALVEHDAVIGENSHISTGAVVNGGVQVGNGVFIGSGAVAREYITIGNRAFIGANKTVSCDIETGMVLK
jgi:sugar O-acyltransferase (sialic acid O-acetyltransferase NeuD family)